MRFSTNFRCTLVFPIDELGLLVTDFSSFNTCKIFNVFSPRDNQLDFLPFRAWIGLWTALLLLLIVAFDLSALVRYITRFTEESFACLIAVIFIAEAFKKLYGNFFFNFILVPSLKISGILTKWADVWPEWFFDDTQDNVQNKNSLYYIDEINALLENNDCFIIFLICPT